MPDRSIETEDEARKWIAICENCFPPVRRRCPNWKKVRDFGRRNKKYTFEEVFGFACIAQEQESAKKEQKK